MSEASGPPPPLVAPSEGESRPSHPRSASELKARRRRRSARRKESRFPRLRALIDSGWFEAILTILAVALILGGLYVYTGNWPPLVVVESDSMQHGDVDTIGVINTGDLVLVEKVNVPSQVTTYVVGESSGYMTYGEYGDVLLYYENGDTGLTPIIHRAIIWLDYNASAGAFSAPSLAGLDCGPATAGGQYRLLLPTGQPYCLPASAPNEALSGTIVLYHVGWQAVTVTISLDGLIAQGSAHSGFVTEGDDNCRPVEPCNNASGAETGTFDQDDCAITCNLVEPGWVEGVARGMIPWFGAIKLWLSGDPGDVPPQTWVYLGITILAIVLLPSLLPPLVRRMRRRTDEDEEEGEGAEPEEKDKTVQEGSPSEPSTEGEAPPS